MKKKLKIAFDLLEKELQAASQNDLNKRKGGFQSNETISGFWAQEGLMFSTYNQPGGIQAYNSSSSSGGEDDYSGNGFWTWGGSGWVWNGEGEPDSNAPHYSPDESGVVIVVGGSGSQSGGGNGGWDDDESGSNGNGNWWGGNSGNNGGTGWGSGNSGTSGWNGSSGSGETGGGGGGSTNPLNGIYQSIFNSSNFTLHNPGVYTSSSFMQSLSLGSNTTTPSSTITVPNGGPIINFVGLDHLFIPQLESSLLDGTNPNDPGAAITLGPIIIYPTGGSNDPQFSEHEPGHVIQFYLLGPLAWNAGVGIPSLISATFFSSEVHNSMPWEKNADQLWALFKSLLGEE